MPTRIRRRLGDFWQSLTAPFRSIGAALVLMWRAGPVPIAGYVLLFTVVTFTQQWLLVGIGRALGPHEYLAFWVPASTLIVMAVTVVVEPVRIAVIAGAYDETAARLRTQQQPACA